VFVFSFPPFSFSFARLPNLAGKNYLIFGLDLAMLISPYFLPQVASFKQYRFP
jgi:hypothetical protein